MAATVSDIIRDAYRDANLIALGQVPTDDEKTEALTLLNRFIRSIFGNEAGDKLSSVAIGSNNILTPSSVAVSDFTGTSYVPVNVRVMANLVAATTLNLHPCPNDGARFAVVDVSNNLNTNTLTVFGNGRRIDGATSLTLNTAGLKKEWFYREDLGQWTTITDVVLTDVFPFPQEFEDYFIFALATRLNPRSGAVMDPQSIQNYRRQRNIFRSRYTQITPTDSEEGLIRLSSNRFVRTEDLASI